MSACATDSSSSAETGSDPIVEASLDNGTKVTFFETRPGAIAIGQEMPLGVSPVETDRMSAVQVFQAIAPGQPVPERLIEAQARADATRSDRPALEVAPPAAEQVSGSAAQSFTSSWFEANYCYNSSNWSFINCYADPMLTANHSGTAYDIDEFKVSACVNSGKVTLRASVEGELLTAVQIAAGYCHSYYWPSGIWNADYFSDSTTINSDTAVYALAVKYNH